MITINKRECIPPFSRLYIDANKIDIKKRPKLSLSDFGRCILQCLRNFNHLYPGIEIYKNVIMPDHIHFIMHVKKRLSVPLGYCIRRFKREIVEKINQRCNPSHKIDSIFERALMISS